MKLQFVKDAIYNGEIVHKFGDCKEIDDSLGMATRWIVRGVAIKALETAPEIIETKSFDVLDLDLDTKLEVEPEIKPKKKISKR
jgi:hypothetical protein